MTHLTDTELNNELTFDGVNIYDEFGEVLEWLANK